MLCELHARAGRDGRFGTADRDDQGGRPVEPVGRFDQESPSQRGVLQLRRCPAAAVADRDLGPIGKGDQVRLHLRSRWEVGRPVHEADLDRPSVRRLAQQAVPVIPLEGP